MPNLLIDKIKELEAISSILEPDDENRAFLMQAVANYANQFINTIDAAPSATYINYQNQILEDSFNKTENIEWILQYLTDYVDKTGLNTASGKYMGYVPGGGMFHSALGDFIADISNRYTGIYSTCPFGVEIENSLIRWMLNIVNYNQEISWGNLTSGGSIANLIAIITARDAKLQQIDFSRAVVYTTSQTHHCVHKALRIAGLVANEPDESGNIHYIDLDENFRLNCDDLKKAIENDRKANKIPWLVAASAGTTNLGLIDPLNEIAEICKTENLWFHVDAAYGGYFLLVDELKQKLNGIEKSDSVVMDAHKGLFLPYGLGTVLIKNKDLLLNAFQYASAYIEEDNYAEKYSPSNMSPELTKPFRGLRLWIPLKLFGVSVFQKAIEEKHWLSFYFYESLSKFNHIEIINKPDLSIFAFRLNPQQNFSYEQLNLLNRKLNELINQSGNVFLSGTTILMKNKNGKHEPVYVIRIAILSFRTHLHHVDIVLETIKKCINKVMNEL